MPTTAPITIPSGPDTTAVMNSLAAMSGTIAIVSLVFVLFSILIWFMIFKRTGMNPWLCLLMLVPIANFIMLLVLAFSQWPVQREVRALRAQLAGGYGGTGYPPPTPPPYNPTLPPPPPTPPTPV